MGKLFNYTLRYSGLNFTNFINFLIKNDIRIFNIKRKSLKEIEFSVNYLNYQKLRKINSQYDLTTIKKGGVKELLKNILKRVGIIVGCTFVIVSNILYRQFSFGVRVVGDTIYAEKIKGNINKFVEQYGNKIDNLKLEKYILENVEELSLVSVKKQGNLILINAMDKKDSMEEYEPLRAPYNMLISEINLISGTLLAEKNDLVKKGSIIVDSYTISSNGDRILVPAKANIVADIWFCGSEIAMKENVSYEKTGNKKVYSDTYFKNIQYDTKMSPYTYYMSETIVINVNNNYFLPIFKVKNIFYETKQVVEIFNFEKEKNNCLEKSKQKAYTSLPKNVIIKEITQNISELSDRYIFQTYLKTTMEIKYED